MFEMEVNPEKIERADLVVGIPSCNEADTIAYPTLQVSIGLKKYFADKKAVIINCDNNSPDNTKKTFLTAPTDVPKIYLSTPPGVQGKGNNLFNLFRKVKELRAEAVLVVDADLKSITPEWIKCMGEPLFKGFSFVTPLYARHKYDGTITNSIAYPLSRALYGKRVRQPIGGDFGFSGDLARIYLETDIRNDAVTGFGIDIWMSTIAMNQQIRLCQSFIGRPKEHRNKDLFETIYPMFRQEVGTIFSLIKRLHHNWYRVKNSKPTAIHGFGSWETEFPPKVDIDTVSLFNCFHDGFREYDEVWKKRLSSDIFGKLYEIREMTINDFTFPVELWARTLYDWAVAYRDADNPDRLMDALVPLYFAKTLSFIRKTEKMTTQQTEAAIEEECMVFESVKPYLAGKWGKKI
ncbi:MAG: glycosyl transferase [Desulfatiglans sp.]|jgi:glycosyltransferase involved in cell wall biosynthesis|nr:glycosyl transferase [Desulfatiglans sp.]